MKLEYLGNEFDQMKGAVLGELQQKGLLNGLIVDSMAGYDEPWAHSDLERYADFLCLRGPEQIARHGKQWAYQKPWNTRKRSLYFAELNRHAGQDFFLDPDVGVTTSKVTREHVKPCEVLSLVQNENVVAVYQHRPHSSFEDRLAKVVEALQQFRPSVECLAYMERRAAMLFLAARPLRLDNIADCLEGSSFPGSLRRFPTASYG